MTLGEKGKLFGQTSEAAVVAQTREQEMATAAHALGIDYLNAGFLDAELRFFDQRELAGVVLAMVRELAPAAIFSFHPQELTPEIHHSDHSEVARLAETVATLVDVNGYVVRDQAGRDVFWDETLVRPEYWVWYSGWLMLQADYFLQEETMIFEQIEEDRIAQLEYVAQYHRSQATAESMEKWRNVLDRVSLNRKTGNYEEHYLKVRS